MNCHLVWDYGPYCSRKKRLCKPWHRRRGKGLQQRIHEQEQQAENIEQFVQRVKKNGTLTELTPYALRELAKAVYVEAPNKSSGKRRQKVHIEYDLVGYIPVDELLKEEQA